MDLRSKTAQPTVVLTAYSANKYIGTPTKLTGLLGKSGTARLRNVAVREAGTQKAPLTLLLVNADPGALADGGTPSLAALGGTIVAQVLVAGADYTTTGGESVAEYSMDKIIKGTPHYPPNTFGNLWLVIVGTGTPTFAAIDALRVVVSTQVGEY